MNRFVRLLAALFVFAGQTAAWPQDKMSTPRKKIPDGVYAVQRDSLNEKELLPLKEAEVVVVHHHRYVKNPDNEPPRFLVVRSAPEVTLDLTGEPRAVKEGTEVVRILVKLQPKAATALERLTRDHSGRQIAIVLGGEVVTMHKIRSVIKGGDVQISNCAPGAGAYLLEQLQAQQKR